MKISIVLVMLSFLATALSEEKPRPLIKFVGKEDVCEFWEGNSPVLFFQVATKSLDGKWPRANYVHPLYGLDGRILTEDFPEDHRHHRGIFWAWHQLWVEGEWVADPWKCENLEWGEPKISTHGRGKGDYVWLIGSVIRDWEVPEFGNVVREKVEISVYPAEEDLRAIDFEIKLRALRGNVRLGGADNEKGYGGFSTRIKLPDDLVFLSQKGEVEPQRTAVEGGAWMDFTGTFDGKLEGLTILVHPSHPGFPVPWILRAKHAQQNVMWPGREPVTLPTDEDIVLRYRLLVHRGRLSAEEIQNRWSAYAKQP